MASPVECTPEKLGEQIASNMEDIESLKGTILASIDSKLSRNEDTMWRKGLKEIKRLQTEQQETLTVVGGLQETQDALAKENQQLRSALCEVTAKFELVVNEMRQALRQLPARGSHHGQISPSPSVASTACSDAATPGLGGLLNATELAQGRVHVGHLERALQKYGPLPESFEEAWKRLVSITEKARLVNELNCLIESRLKVGGKLDDSRDECRTLLTQYEDALRKLQKGALLVLDTQQPRQATQDESFLTEPTPPSSKGNLSLQMGFTPSWPALAEDPGESFSTPPRGAMSAEDPGSSFNLAADACWQTWQGQYDPSPGFPGMANASAASVPMSSSPAAVLSLASALAIKPEDASPSGGLKQLQLAECLAETTNEVTPSKYSTPTQSPLQVELHKEPGFVTLGMEVNEENGTAIRVQSIDESGLVGRHNRAQSSGSSRINVGDLIIEINGIAGDPVNMLQECKTQQVLILKIIRGSSPVPSIVPSPPGGNNSACFTGSTDGGELERVLAEVTSMQGFKEISAPPASWGRLRPEATVFVPALTPTSEAIGSASMTTQDAASNDKLEDASALMSGAAEGDAVAHGSQDGLARLLFSP